MWTIRFIFCLSFVLFWAKCFGVILCMFSCVGLMYDSISSGAICCERDSLVARHIAAASVLFFMSYSIICDLSKSLEIKVQTPSTFYGEWKIPVTQYTWRAQTIVSRSYGFFISGGKLKNDKLTISSGMEFYVDGRAGGKRWGES